jgi:hypothetical protein
MSMDWHSPGEEARKTDTPQAEPDARVAGPAVVAEKAAEHVRKEPAKA